MHKSTALISLFAIGALSAPSVNKHAHLHHKRDEATQYETAYVTQYTTVEAPAQPAPTAEKPPSPPPFQHRHKAAAPPQANDVNADAFQGWNNQFRPQGAPQSKNGDTYYWFTTYTEGSPAPTGAPQPPKYQPAPVPSSAPAPAPSSAPAASPAPQPSSKAPAPAPAPSAPSTSGLNTYQKNIIDSHNAHRSNHSCGGLEWSDGLANAAQQLAQTCNWGHNTDLGKDTCGFDGYGQNLAAGITTDKVADAVSGMWYNGEMTAFAGNYGQANPTNGFESWGHFTQMVWDATTHVGCATQDCSASGVTGTSVNPAFLTVCNYGPAGNVEGEYGDNVKQPKGMPTVSGA